VICLTGWVCYGEKLHPQSLPFISRVKSPQQIMGSLIKGLYAPRQNLTPDQIIHVTLMSCFDRKLEASRLDFAIPDYRMREVDHVVTAIEVEELLRRFGKSLAEYKSQKLVNLFPDCGSVGGSIVKSHFGSGSGGYAEFVLRAMSQNLYGKVPENVVWQQGRYALSVLGTRLCIFQITRPWMTIRSNLNNFLFLYDRNSDIWESVLRDDSGKVVLKFGIATGFRNIQTIVRKLKSKVMAAQLPHYIEIMACPTGTTPNALAILELLPCLDGHSEIPSCN